MGYTWEEQIHISMVLCTAASAKKRFSLELVSLCNWDCPGHMNITHYTVWTNPISTRVENNLESGCTVIQLTKSTMARLNRVAAKSKKKLLNHFFVEKGLKIRKK